MHAPRGAYGFRIDGIDGGSALRVSGSEDWPRLRVRQELDTGPFPAGARLTEDRAWIRTPAAHLVLDRAAASVTVRSPTPVPDADLVHPGLWPAAAVFGRWRDAEALHGGAIVDRRGGAWGILGDGGAGKSVLLALLAVAGESIVADDMLVVEGANCFAGPRCIDLRPDVARRLEIKEPMLRVRSTERFRLALAPTAATHPLRGFIYLEWASQLSVGRLAPGESLGLLTAHRRVKGLGVNLHHLLDLAGLPALRLQRPRAWNRRAEVCAAVLDAINT